ncbi:MAG: thioredoxin family protein [Aeoliella sp.]
MSARSVLLLLVFAITCFPASMSAVHAESFEGVSWHKDLDAARDIAQQEGKLLLVHFWTESCGPCRLLDANVFNQPTVATSIEANYVPVKLDASEFRATAQRFGITRVPTDVIITPAGEVLDKSVSPATPMAYISQVNSIAQAYKHRSGRDFEQVASNAGGAEPLNSAYANLAVPVDTTAGAAPVEDAIPGVMANPYVSPPNGAAGDRYATPPVVGQPVAAAEPTTPPTAPTINQFAQTTPEATVGPETPTATRLPPGSPPLGFHGYCPVTMKQSWEWKQGDVRWGAVHRGRTYLFAGAEQRDEFLKNPDGYSPALSGADAVLAIDQNQVEPGERQFAVEYQGQFYLFTSEETLRQFWANAEKYSTGVRQAMISAPQRTLR